MRAQHEPELPSNIGIMILTSIFNITGKLKSTCDILHISIIIRILVHDCKRILSTFIFETGSGSMHKGDIFNLSSYLSDELKIDFHKYPKFGFLHNYEINFYALGVC